MSLTVLETIASKLLTRLEGMTAGTYNTNVSSVYRLAVNGGEYAVEHLQIVIKQGDDEIVDELMRPGNPPAIAHRQVFNLRCHVLPSERDTDPVETTNNTFAADVIKCLTTPANWYQWDGNAIDTQIGAVQNINEDGGIDGFNLPVTVLYRVDENNPYEVRA